MQITQLRLEVNVAISGPRQTLLYQRDLTLTNSFGLADVAGNQTAGFGSVTSVAFKENITGLHGLS
jgi:hypothetical protein